MFEITKLIFKWITDFGKEIMHYIVIFFSLPQVQACIFPAIIMLIIYMLLIEDDR